MFILTGSFTIPQSQNCGRDHAESHRERKTECSPPIHPFGRGQGYDRRLEAGPHRNSQSFQCTLTRLYLVFISDPFQALVSSNNNAMLTKMFREMFPDDRGIANDPHQPVSAIFLTANKPPIVSQSPARSVPAKAWGQVSHAEGDSPGEVPPPPPDVCVGRDDLIEEIVGFAQNLKSTAIIGAGGIGKTSIALSVLYHHRIKEKFGDNRRFIRCDQLTRSHANFLARLSEVTGAGVENPKDLTSLRPFLSSREIFLILDNAESILDSEGKDAQDIYSTVKELCQSETTFVCITSRDRTVPSSCERPAVPTLSMEAAREIFYTIYKGAERPKIIDDILRELDFHAFSIDLFATTGFRNEWDHDRLAKEWNAHRVGLLQGLPATINFSLASPTFRKLGSKAHDVLRVIAFFPQGVNEKNIDWLFPNLSLGTGILTRLLPTRTHDGTNIFDKLCLLSLTYRSNGFITMLAPIREYFTPKDPKSSPLLRETKKRYFTRLLIDVGPEQPSFGEAEWIKSEDVNVEHLLDVFMSIKADAGVLNACTHFMELLFWHKPRQTVLGSKIEGLPDDNPSKAKCLSQLSRLLESVGNNVERKRLLSQVLQLERKQGNDRRVAQTLRRLSDANRMLGLYEEGMQQAEEAMRFYEGLDDMVGRADSLTLLTRLLNDDKQLDAAEEAVTHAIELLPEKGQEFRLCQCHTLLGDIYRSKGERERAIRHFEVALEITSPFNWRTRPFWIHHSLARLFHDENDFNNAQAHIEQAKSYVGEGKYLLCRVTLLQAQAWYREGKLEDARSEAVRAKEIYEQLGLAHDVQVCMALLQKIEKAAG